MNKNEQTAQFTDESVIEGYWMDAKGALIPESMIKPLDKERETLIGEIVLKTKYLNQQLKAFKDQTFGDIAAFVELSAEQYKANVGGKKGNITLFSFDGKYKVQRSMQDRIAPDERILAVRQLMLDCVHEWTNGARPELIAIVNRAFVTDKDGNLKLSRLLELRRLEIKDERWLNAMIALSESLQVVGSRAYIRVYERIADSQEYQPISLDIAGV